MPNITLTMNISKAIAVHDCLARYVEDLMEKGWTIDKMNEFTEYHNIVTVCNEIADAYPECNLERY